MSSLAVLGGLCSLVALAGGCLFRQNTVASRFGGEYRCPERMVKVEKVDPDRFRATGCNRRALYRCTGEYGELCERVGQPETIHPEESGAPTPGGEPAQSEPAAP